MMDNKRSIVLALRTLLRPIVRLLITLGFNARDFIEVAKTVYVEVATQQYGKRGRPTNMSRVAVLTGLTRREVARLRKVSSHDPLQLADPMVPVGRILSTWHQEPRLLDRQGQPRLLTLNPEFTRLVEQHRGDIPVQTLISELQAAGAIEISGGMVRALSRYFMPFELDPQAIERFGRVLGDAGNSIAHNLLAPSRGNSFFEGRAVSELVSANAADAFRKFLDRSGQNFLEAVDDWLTDHAEKGGEHTTRLGVGIYTIHHID
ncbi:MAG: hypothetical protein H6993_16480 [Pseudomonadales bacterium]|nr:hypothetical protein [Pseudomonadales bacterium]MCP5185563.1 hypothetical protein [Pseudomonadales bacterium]